MQKGIGVNEHSARKYRSRIYIDETGYLMESKPTITDDTYIFQLQLQHFTDACAGKVPCLCPAEHGTRIMRIINAIYESAETGKEVLFD